MASYYSQMELDQFEQKMSLYREAHDEWIYTNIAAQKDYEGQVERWQQAEEDAQTEYEEAHASWEEYPTAPDGTPIPEPQPPEPKPKPPEPQTPPEPQPPEEPRIFAAEEISGPVDIVSEAGVVMVLPPSVVITGPDESQIAMLPDDFSRSFVPVPVEPTPREEENASPATA